LKRHFVSISYQILGQPALFADISPAKVKRTLHCKYLAKKSRVQQK
jgi:hypothetical protein